MEKFALVLWAVNLSTLGVNFTCLILNGLAIKDRFDNKSSKSKKSLRRK